MGILHFSADLCFRTPPKGSKCWSSVQTKKTFLGSSPHCLKTADDEKHKSYLLRWSQKAVSRALVWRILAVPFAIPHVVRHSLKSCLGLVWILFRLQFFCFLCLFFSCYPTCSQLPSLLFVRIMIVNPSPTATNWKLSVPSQSHTM